MCRDAQTAGVGSEMGDAVKGMVADLIEAHWRELYLGLATLGHGGAAANPVAPSELQATRLADIEAALQVVVDWLRCPSLTEADSFFHRLLDHSLARGLNAAEINANIDLTEDLVACLVALYFAPELAARALVELERETMMSRLIVNNELLRRKVIFGKQNAGRGE